MPSVRQPLSRFLMLALWHACSKRRGRLHLCVLFACHRTECDYTARLHCIGPQEQGGLSPMHPLDPLRHNSDSPLDSESARSVLRSPDVLLRYRMVQSTPYRAVGID